MLYLFISLSEPEHPLKHQIKEHTLLYLFISLTEPEHPLKHQIKEHTHKFKIDNEISHSNSQSTATYYVSKNKPLLCP